MATSNNRLRRPLPPTHINRKDLADGRRRVRKNKKRAAKKEIG